MGNMLRECLAHRCAVTIGNKDAKHIVHFPDGHNEQVEALPFEDFESIFQRAIKQREKQETENSDIDNIIERAINQREKQKSAKVACDNMEWLSFAFMANLDNAPVCSCGATKTIVQYCGTKSLFRTVCPKCGHIGKTSTTLPHPEISEPKDPKDFAPGQWWHVKGCKGWLPGHNIGMIVEERIVPQRMFRICFCKGIYCDIEERDMLRNAIPANAEECAYHAEVEKVYQETIQKSTIQKSSGGVRMPKIQFKKIHKPGRPTAIMPVYKTPGASGMDVASPIDITIRPGDIAIIELGFAVAISEGYEFQIRPRSGISYRTKLRLPNTPGTIDSDYRGEVGVIIENIGKDDCVITRGERIAQFVLCPVAHAELIEVEELPKTQRGDGGFGSTGK